MAPHTIFNEPLASNDLGYGEPTESSNDPTSDTFVWVALSGGGTRAAALAWAVLHEFEKIRFPVADGSGVRTSDLAAEIDHISGISGGSFAAAAWTLFRDRPDRRKLFEERFLNRNLHRALARNAFLPPWRGLRLVKPQYSRSHVAANLYHQQVFDSETFGDLPGRPGLHIHATLLALGERFTFSPETFGQLGSDLRRYPIGYACAASSAFPVLLSPISLRNHGVSMSHEDLQMNEPRYRRAVVDSRDQIEQDLRRKHREYFNDKAVNRYIHLADGGLVDNQGLQAMLDEFEGGGLVTDRMNNGDLPMKRLILVNVNAGTGRHDESGSHLRPPSWRSVMMTTMVSSMDVLSAKRWMRIQSHCRTLFGSVRDRDTDLAYNEMNEPYTVEINFRNLTDDDFRSRCQALPTSFHLTRDQLELISEAAHQLVTEDPHVIRLMAEDGPVR